MATAKKAAKKTAPKRPSKKKVSAKALARLFKELHKMVEPFEDPIVDAMVKVNRSPFRVLIATVLSLRTKDEVTGKAADRLFQLADNPKSMAKLDEELIAKTIYPVGFYKTKAKTVIDVCQTLLDTHKGKVPNNMDELLALKGVGRKTANLVLSAGFQMDAICVDTHVHRICNRWDYLKTKTPDETEDVLRQILPKKYWQTINGLLVTMGQNICTPQSPWCSKCSLQSWWCPQRDVKRSR